VPQARGGRLQIGITAAMKLEQYDGLGVGDFLHQPRECWLGGLQRPEIVGQIENPSLEAVRRLWWRAFDRVCYWMVLIRLSVQDRIYGPEPPILADLEHEAGSREAVLTMLLTWRAS
jgi:hypothetical protein